MCWSVSECVKSVKKSKNWVIPERFYSTLLLDISMVVELSVEFTDHFICIVSSNRIIVKELSLHQRCKIGVGVAPEVDLRADWDAALGKLSA